MADNTDNSPVAAAAAATRNEYNVSQTTNPADASIHSSSTAPKQTSEPMTTSEPNPAGASIQSPSTAPKEAPVPTTTTTSEQNPAPQQQQPGQVDTDAPGREQAEKTVEPGDDGPKHPVENAPDEDSEETKQHKAKGETWTGASWIKFDKVKPGDPEMSSGKELQEMENQKEKEDEAAAAKNQTGTAGSTDTEAKKEGVLEKVQEKLHMGHHSQ